MTQLQVLQDIDGYALQAGFWAAVAFPVVTGFFWRWWAHIWGWTIVGLDLAVALALLGPVLVVEFGLIEGDTPGHILSWTTAVALCLVPLIIVWRGFLTWYTQTRGSRE